MFVVTYISARPHFRRAICTIGHLNDGILFEARFVACGDRIVRSLVAWWVGMEIRSMVGRETCYSDEDQSGDEQEPRFQREWCGNRCRHFEYEKKCIIWMEVGEDARKVSKKNCCGNLFKMCRTVNSVQACTSYVCDMNSSIIG